MKRTTLFYAFIVLGILYLLALAAVYSPPFPAYFHGRMGEGVGYSGGSFFIAKNQEITEHFALKNNYTATVILTITGNNFNPEEYFSFKIMDPNQTVIVDAENLTVGIEYSFNFKATTEGDYPIVYENHAEGRHVRVLSHMKSNISPAENQDGTFTWIILNVLLIGLVLTMSTMLIWGIKDWRKKRKEKRQQKKQQGTNNS